MADGGIPPSSTAGTGGLAGPRAAVSVGPVEPTAAEVEPGGRGPLLDLPPVPLPPPAGGDQKARSLAGRAALSLALLAGAGFLAVGVLVAIVGINVLLFQAGRR